MMRTFLKNVLKEERKELLNVEGAEPLRVEVSLVATVERPKVQAHRKLWPLLATSPPVATCEVWCSLT